MNSVFMGRGYLIVDSNNVIIEIFFGSRNNAELRLSSLNRIDPHEIYHIDGNSLPIYGQEFPNLGDS